MNRNKLTIAAVALGAAAALALGQSAGNDSAGPTRNDYRLQLVEPAEGATVTGSTVRVVVNTEIQAEIGETKRDVNSMPRPSVDVFLDDQNKGSMRDANNVLTIDGVEPGDHKIVLLAKNRSGEIIDRKEVRFKSIAGTTAAGSANTILTRPDATLEPVDHRVPAAAASAPGSTQAVMLPPAEPARPAEMSPSRSAQAAAPRTLPATATSDPLLISAGLVLLLGGLSLRRFN